MYNNIVFECPGIQIDMEASLNLQNVSFYDNYAYNKVGVVSILTKSRLWVRDSTFERNIVAKRISTFNIFGSSIVRFSLIIK